VTIAVMVAVAVMVSLGVLAFPVLTASGTVSAIIVASGRPAFVTAATFAHRAAIAAITSPRALATTTAAATTTNGSAAVTTAAATTTAVASAAAFLGNEGKHPCAIQGRRRSGIRRSRKSPSKSCKENTAPPTSGAFCLGQYLPRIKQHSARRSSAGFSLDRCTMGSLAFHQK
jgi:hypothetical protein